MRPKVIQIRRLTKDELRIAALLYPERGYWRPFTRQDCASFQRPCPYVACRYHLYLDVDENSGSIRINYPDKEVWQIEHSCALDVADGPDLTLEEVGQIMAVTRERVRQIESVAQSGLKRLGAGEILAGEALPAEVLAKLESPRREREPDLDLWPKVTAARLAAEDTEPDDEDMDDVESG